MTRTTYILKRMAWTAGIFAVLYFAIDLLVWCLIARWSLRHDRQAMDQFRQIIQSTHILVLLGFCVVWGFVRLCKHPVLNTRYLQWLRTTPWTPALPLPLGSARLNWLDALFLAGITLFGHYHTRIIWEVPLIAFGVPLILVALNLLAATGRRASAIMLAVGLALLIRQGANFPQALAITTLLYLVYHLDLRNSLEWCAGPAHPDERDTTPLGWPFNRLGPPRPQKEYRLRDALLIGAVAGWIVYCVTFRVNSENPSDMSTAVALAIAFAMFAALGRLVNYTGYYHSPISLRGRLHTGRLIIPSYDQVLIAPLLIALTAAAIPLAGWAFQVSWPIVVGTIVFATLAIAFGAGPTLQDWHLTGGHQIVTRKTLANV